MTQPTPSTGRDVILHPRMHYGSYIISLHDLWRKIQQELSHHYRYTANRHREQVTVNQDVDRFLEAIVKQSEYKDRNMHEPLRDISYHLLHPDSHYDFSQNELHAFIAQTMHWFFDMLAVHLPWLVVTPDLDIFLRMRNRFDLYISVHPTIQSHAKTYPLLTPR